MEVSNYCCSCGLELRPEGHVVIAYIVVVSPDLLLAAVVHSLMLLFSKEGTRCYEKCSAAAKIGSHMSSLSLLFHNVLYT